MLNTNQKTNLEEHIINISFSLISQITRSGAVLARFGDEVAPDIVSTHHIANLILSLNKDIFLHYVESMAGWMADPNNGFLESQFTLDTLSQVTPDNEDLIQFVESQILPTQLNSGAFTRYTAYLHGGDYFSTLWCIKILQNFSGNRYDKEINKGITYLINNSSDTGIQINQLGFLYLILKKSGNAEREGVTQQIRTKILSYIQNTPLEHSDLLWRLYLYEDLLIDPHDQLGLSVVNDEVCQLFELDKKAESLPAVFNNLAKIAPETVVYHCLARAAIVGLKLLEDGGEKRVCFAINRHLQSRGQNALYIAAQQDAELKEYLMKYGNIHKEFEKYNNVLQKAWKQATFDKSIFIMMPFREGAKYKILTDTIKKACKKRGYKAIRTDDQGRKFSDNLWDNIVINMLSCKYAISIYFSEPVIDVLDAKEVKMFANPNVALEFGFFKSRGQEILLLKDNNSPLPSDMQGFLWHPFDIEDPKAGVNRAVSDFLDKIEEEERTKAIPK
jgi:hypothetical protein